MAGPVRIAILANGAQARREIDSVGGSLGKLAKVSVAGYGLTRLAGGIGGLISSSVQLESQFSTTMRVIGATTQAPASELQKLNDLALDLGAKTSFSASEAADAMLELAKAGLSTSTIMGGALAGTLQLAAAGGTDLGTASTIAANALNTFGLKGTDMGKIAAALAGGANASTASVESLGQALSQVGPGATNAGLSLNETVAALAAFDSAGIKGSDAGTSLKTMLSRLVPQTKAAQGAMDALGITFTNADGSFKSITQIAGTLQTGFRGLSDEQRSLYLSTIFGSDATRAATVLLKEGSKGIQGYIKATKDQNAAQDAAAAYTGGTAGALERLSGSVETAKLKLGQEFAPTVERVANGLSENIGPAVESGIDFFKRLGNAAAPAVKTIVDNFDALVPGAGGVSDFFDRLIPTVDTASQAFAALAPVALQITSALGDLAPGVLDTANSLSGSLIPPLEALAGLATGVLAFVNDLPGPVKQIGVEAGIAALILPRLTTSVTGVTTAVGFNIARLQQLRAELTYTATRTQLVTGAMARLGGAARAAAGIAGMVALTQASKQSNDGLQILTSTLGGAATGFALGGPIGALIGGAGGGLVGLAGATHDASREMDAIHKSADGAKGAQLDLRQALDQTTGAMTKQARQTVSQDLYNQKLGASARTLGLSERDVVSAILGQEGAYKRVSAAIERYQNAGGANSTNRQNALSDAAVNLSVYLDGAIPKFKAAQNEIREVAAGSRSWGEALKGLPKEVRTQVKSDGGRESIAQIAQLTRRYNLTPKQVRTLISANGSDKSVADVQKVINKLKAVDNTKVTLPAFGRGVKTTVNLAESVASQGGARIAGKLKAGTGKAKADLGPFKRSVTTGLAAAEGPARVGGFSIGDAMKAGVINGFQGTAAQLAAAATAAVRQGIAAGKRAGDINSPSRKTHYLGEMLGQGLADGITARKGAVGSATAGLVAAALAGLNDYSERPIGGIATDNVSTAIDNVTTLIGDTYDSALKQLSNQLDRKYDKLEKSAKKRLKGKAEDKAVDRLEKKRDQTQKKADQANSKAQKAALAGLQAQFIALKANAAQHDIIAQKLEDAQQAYKALADEAQSYADSVRDAVVASGSLSSLGEGDGFGSVDDLISQLQVRVQAAQTYASVIQSLTAAGLNQTSLQQLIDAGVQGGLGTAQAILDGGPSAIAQINQLTGQLVATGTALGASTSQTMYGAGLAAANGLVQGLQSQLSAIEAVGTTLGNALAAAVKSALGIASPSRVFRGIGSNTVDGLVLGLDDTYVKRQGTRLATSLRDGFATPALDAYMSAPGTRSGFPSNLRLTLSAQETDQLRRGRDIQVDLSAYLQAGGSRPA